MFMAENDKPQTSRAINRPQTPETVAMLARMGHIIAGGEAAFRERAIRRLRLHARAGDGNRKVVAGQAAKRTGDVLEEGGGRLRRHKDFNDAGQYSAPGRLAEGDSRCRLYASPGLGSLPSGHLPIGNQPRDRPGAARDTLFQRRHRPREETRCSTAVIRWHRTC